MIVIIVIFFLLTRKKNKRVFSEQDTMNEKQYVFIHIPKSGGSTIIKYLVTLFPNYYLINQAQFPTPDIISNKQLLTFDKIGALGSPCRFLYDHEWSKSTMFLLSIRNPVSLKLSEFYFYNHLVHQANNGFPEKLMKKFSTLVSFLKNGMSHNTQTKYLLGRDILDPAPVTDEEFNRLIEWIKGHKVFAFLVERLGECLSLFEDSRNLRGPDEILRYKQNYFKPKESDLLSSTINLIKENNKYDFLLYQFFQNRLNLSRSLRSKRVREVFYPSTVTEKYPLIIYLRSSKFFDEHKDLLNTVRMKTIEKLGTNVTEEQYLDTWMSIFIEEVKGGTNLLLRALYEQSKGSNDIKDYAILIDRHYRYEFIPYEMRVPLTNYLDCPIVMDDWLLDKLHN